MAHRAHIVLAPLLVLLVGCVALSSHDGNWPCQSDSDCPDADWCNGGTCFPRGACNGASDCYPQAGCSPYSPCSSKWACINKRCAAAECDQPSDPACGDYACHLDTGKCGTDCTLNTDCTTAYFVCAEGRCHAGTCSGSPELCRSNPDEDSCIYGAGCQWGVNGCYGTPTKKCSDQKYPYDCTRVAGCSWQ